VDVAESLMLEAQHDAVPRARRFATSVLAGSHHRHLSFDVQLVVTELVTNALLHAAMPVRLAIRADTDCVRVQVHDGSRVLPVRPLRSTEAMTGRGLALVGALTRMWRQRLQHGRRGTRRPAEGVRRHRIPAPLSHRPRRDDGRAAGRALGPQ